MAIANAVNAHEYPIPMSTSDIALPGANLAATITYAAGGAGVYHAIGGVAWSYNATPTGGNLVIQDGSGNTIFSIDITAAGPGAVNFNPPKRGSANTALIVNLAAGGVSVTGKVSVLSRWAESVP